MQMFSDDKLDRSSNDLINQFMLNLYNLFLNYLSGHVSQ